MLPLTTILVVVSFALIGLPSLLAAINIARRRKSEKGSGFYEDVDGVATEQSQKQFSAKGPIISLLVVSVLALSSSFALAVSSTPAKHGNNILLPAWLHAGEHFAILIQGINVALERNPIRRFNSSAYTALSHAIVAITASLLYTQWNGRTVKALLLVDVLCSIAAFVSGMLVPRRPKVFLGGKNVDGERTVSLLNRLTFTWMAELVDLVRAKSWLTMDDVPILGYQSRSSWLLNTHPELQPDQTLFRLLLRCHRGALAAQYFMTFMDAITVQAPSVAMLMLLRTLESRHASGDQSAPIALWVVLLGVFLFLTQFVESVGWYISYSYIQVPFRTHLSALVYAKALRRKDVKGVADVSGLESEDAENKTQQGTVNLVGVDVFRVSYFALVNNWFFGAFCKILISFSLLGYLVGWQALLAGLTVQILSMPLNTFFSKKYAKAQNDVMKVRDRKLAVVTEILKGIRHVKFAAHEDRVQSQIKEVRDEELSQQWRSFRADIGLMFCWLFGPIMLSAVALAVHALVYGELLPSVAFTTMGVLNSIQVTLALIPELATNAIDAWVSLKRVEKYLHAPEIPEVTTPGESIEFQDADFAWPVDDQDANREFIIRKANLSFPNNELSIIAGGTGSGKSLMLAAILGEADLISGAITVPKGTPGDCNDNEILNQTNWIQPGTLAFVSQQPWIENGTFKENILFRLPFDKERYESVVDACALTQDRKILSDGDETEIGANGVNVSGGQKWRITLARALYSRAGVLIMDDIFSAVDAHVGRHIFANALCGKIGAGRTRILATHHVSLVVGSAKYAVHLSNGQVEYSGSIEHLKRTGALQSILLEEDKVHEEAVEEAEEIVPIVVAEGDNEGTGIMHREAGYQSINTSHNHTVNRRRSSARKSSNSIRPNGLMDEDNSGKTTQVPKKFVEDESRQIGRIAFNIYVRYWKASGYLWFWAGYAGVLIALEVLRLGQSWWVKLWTQSYETEQVPKAYHISHQQQLMIAGTSNQTMRIREVDANLKYYLGIYFGFACLLLIAGIGRSIFMFTGSIRASQKLYEDLTYRVLRAKLRWWDTMPLGRILNRFTSDFTIVDSELCWTMCTVFDQTLVILGIIVAGILVSPYVVVFSFLLIAISLRYSLYYLDGTREMKRLESIAKSPIFEILGTTLTGLGTIRAFKKQDIYKTNMFAKIDVYGATSYYIAGMNRWLSIRLGLIGAIFAVIIAVIVTSIKDFDPSLAGFALSFALQYTDAIYWLLRQFGITEMAMNSVERIQEYTETEIEDQGGKPAPAAWPSKGRLEIDNLVVGYAEDLPPVLRGITLGIEPNERCAIVGRTGAGKSSMALALFRFLAAREGRIVIDGIDIATMRLKDLRSRLAIIPQDPVLFSGTVRSNLDPFSEHSDDALREALERVHLIKGNDSGSSTPPTTSGPTEPTVSTANTNPFASLSTTIAESGSNLSQGQRQLLCLARAILHRPKILILDEATSAVDKATDTLIQQSVREQFSDSTLLVIAHRLSTIADFDRVCVLGDGKILEYDRPEVLMQKDGGKGAFASMVEESGEKDLIKEMLSERKK
ncbi:putative ABC bile acid transporter [Pseudovirgaria hyperparasitica]|uniref:ABC bile acid transporter n=1 Tax=Pseudovirgaria hyperparasitica TaxID=470096 RepID=A0A6A6W144_9PEZI|nr:putative ABC bile acid transporter [Pseudovirgaria hyperparasitica]KAF2756245.1 putative ABC bile acid transporter [Pseudovirgaria hyperparasitica]